MAPTTGRPPKTIEDYMALPDDVRAELIGGDLYVTTAPTPLHQTTVLRLAIELALFVEREGLGQVFLSPVDVELPTEDVVQPDLLFLSRQSDAFVGDWIQGVPDLAIEVVSKTHAERDRIVKHGVYERGCVPEYWIVDPCARTLEVFRLEKGVYRPAGFVGGEGEVRTPRLPGFSLDVARLFA